MASTRRREPFQKESCEKAGDAIQSTEEQAESYTPLKRIVEPLKITKRAHAQKGKCSFRYATARKGAYNLNACLERGDYTEGRRYKAKHSYDVAKVQIKRTCAERQGRIKWDSN